MINVDDEGFCNLVPKDKPPVFCQEKDCLNCEVNFKYMPITDGVKEDDNASVK